MNAQNQLNDPWFGQDKAKHFVVSTFLAGSGYGISSLVLEKPWQRAVVGSTLSLTIGMGKEIYDFHQGRNMSSRDMAWNLFGAIVGVTISFCIDMLLQSYYPTN